MNETNPRIVFVFPELPRLNSPPPVAEAILFEANVALSAVSYGVRPGFDCAPCPVINPSRSLVVNHLEGG